MKSKNVNKKNKSSFREWIEAISIALVVIILFRFFCFDLFVVPSTSMEGTVLSGDFVLVNKFNYGSRIPTTPFSVPFAHQYMPFSESRKSYSSIVQITNVSIICFPFDNQYFYFLHIIFQQLLK